MAGFDSETEVDLSDWIHEAGGEIVSKNHSKVIDYLIVPIQNSPITMKAKETVTNLWLESNLFLLLFQLTSVSTHKNVLRIDSHDANSVLIIS